MEFLEDSSLEELMQKGINEFDEGNLNEAITFFKYLTEYFDFFKHSYKDSKLSHLSNYYLGLSFEKSFKFAKAINFFNKAIQLSYKDPFSLYHRGLCYEGLGENKLAISDISKAIKRNPNIKDFYIKRGQLYQAQGDFSSAKADYGNYLKFDKKNSSKLKIYAELCTQTNSYKSAINSYKKLERLTSSNFSEEINNLINISKNAEKAKHEKKEAKRKKEEEKILNEAKKEAKKREEFRNQLSLFGEYNLDQDSDLIESNYAARELIIALGLDERNCREFVIPPELKMNPNSKDPLDEISNYIFPAGAYCIGDLYHVVPDYVNQNDTFYYEDSYVFSDSISCDILNGIAIAKKGSVYANIRTLFGQALYKDNYGNKYDVEKGGSIGIIPIKEIDISTCYKIAIFPKPFNINFDRKSGIIRFGNIFIDTDLRFMGQRINYFFDEKNLYEANHPSNLDNKNIEVRFDNYENIKDKYPKDKERNNWLLSKFILKNINQAIYSKDPNPTSNILSFVANSLQNIDSQDTIEINQEIDKILSEPLGGKVKDWVVFIKNKQEYSSFIKNNNLRDNIYYSYNKETNSMIYDEEAAIKNVNFARIKIVIKLTLLEFQNLKTK